MKNPTTLFRAPAATVQGPARTRSNRRIKTVRAVRLKRALRDAGRFALCLVVLCQGMLFVGASPRVAAQVRTAPVRTAPAQTTTTAPANKDSEQGQPVQPISSATFNFEALAQRAAAMAASSDAPAADVGVSVDQPVVPGGTELAPEGFEGANAPDASLDVPPGNGDGPLAPSPAPASNFQAQADVPKPDGPQAGFSFIPPDTHGAVGQDKLVVMLNNVVTIQNKLTGVPLSTVSEDTFWNAGSATPRGSSYFDPKVLYDPYNNRFIATILSNGISANTRMHVAVSLTSDPQGSWFITTLAVGTAALGADFPSIGFNKDWVTISLNMFNNASPFNFSGGNIYAFDYPQLRNGVVNAFSFTNTASANLTLALTLQPAVTYSPTEATTYIVRTQFNDPIVVLRLLGLTGTPPAAPTLTAINNSVPIGESVNRSLGEVLPQAPPLVGTGTRKLDGDDARITNVVFRNGSIWAAHHFGACAANNCTAAGQLTRTVAQAYEITPTGTVLQRLRVEDPTATATNGGNWYAYPSLAVNANNDVMMGYTQCASDQWASAGYSVKLAADAANTIRDPQIYKAGLGYYEKTFSSTRNRWGDYSNTQVDPSNDRDMWTIQEHSNPQVGTGNGSGRWGTWWAKVVTSASAVAGNLIISEYRTHGPGGTGDEFVEIYNTTNSAITVQTSFGDASTGFAVVSSDAPTTPKFIIPNGTTIPAKGHYLGVNSTAYSLTTYPAGVGTTATGDATFITDIPDSAGLAIFNSATTLDATTRLDSVGSASTPAGLFKEGAGVPDLVDFTGTSQYSYFRKLETASSQDTQDNANDFRFVDTVGTCRGASCASPVNNLGAPGPENLSSPLMKRADTQIISRMIDPAVGSTQSPNRVRDASPAAQDCATNSCLGTLSTRRTFINNTGVPVTRLRFRIVDITTFRTPIPAGLADVRARTNPAPTFVVTTSSGPMTIQRTEVEGISPGSPSTAEPAQPAGGGYNTTLTVTLASPIAPNASVNVEFLLGVMQSGSFRFFVMVEALP
ncbi:MAG TPA: lamin tail domain-containing protein [Pyrinomonadaceae bacterium]|nr:lamin tail domain-containing protein [Pyrinomonadaceae bacterium]